jgi:exodeoxyribonuclease V alpha subunit
METIRCIVTRDLLPPDVTDRAFFMAQYETPDGLVLGKFSGRGASVVLGDCVVADGDWEDAGVYKGQPNTVFKARRIRPDLPHSRAGAELMLRLCFNSEHHGLGAPQIRSLFAKHGENTMAAAVSLPDVLVRESSDPKRFGSAILKEWAARAQGGQAVSLMEVCKVSTRAIESIIAEFSKAPLEVLRENPYKAAPLTDVGFENADLIGRHLGFPADDQKRLTAAVGEVLRKEAALGSTSVNLETMLAKLSKVSRIDREVLVAFLQDAAGRDDHELAIYRTPGTGVVSSLLRYYVAEVDILNGVKILISSGRRNPADAAANAVSDLFSQTKFKRFDEVQRTAVEMAIVEPISILTGGPGTGKSTVMDAVATISKSLDKRLFMAAPTGMAAKRLEETTGIKAQTVHSLLKARDEQRGIPQFAHGRDNLLPAGCFVVVDEASMLDVETAAALLNAMPPDGRLLLVGDKNQLPSVGAGSVLGDLIAAEAGQRRVIPSVELVNVYRQAKDSGIATGAALIRDGNVPELTKEDQGGVSFQETDSSDIVQSVERLVCVDLPLAGYDPIKDVAVLCPMAPGPGGTWEINTRLSARLNPGGAAIPGVARTPRDDPRMPLPRCGDRVMLTENDSKNGVMNGDVGTISGTGKNEAQRPTFTVAFDSGETVTYPAARWRLLILAFAGTIHKSQGSQYPVVVMPMASAHKKMLERTLVYTGYTRAQKKLVLLGERAAFEFGVQTYKGDERNTLLQSFLGNLDPRTLSKGVDWRSRALAAQRRHENSAPVAAAALPVPLPVPARLFRSGPRPSGANGAAPLPRRPSGGGEASLPSSAILAPMAPAISISRGRLFAGGQPQGSVSAAEEPAREVAPQHIKPFAPSLFGALKRPAPRQESPDAGTVVEKPMPAIARRRRLFSATRGPDTQEDEATPVGMTSSR